MTHPSSPSHTPSPDRVARARRLRATRGSTLAVAAVAAVGAYYFARPEQPLLAPPRAVAAVAQKADFARPFAHLADAAFGRSGEVRMRFSLPGDTLYLPLIVADAPGVFAYTWVDVRDSSEVGTRRPLTGDSSLVAPEEPGFYRLAVVRDGLRSLVDEVTVSVLVPFAEKKGATIGGYRIGTYVGEKLAARRAGLPDGFFRVDDAALELPVSRHLKLGDVLTTPDTPRLGFPQYATLDERLIEKLELVVAKVNELARQPAPQGPRITVNSGFRPPSYNARVPGAAKNSRHQYGDAADVKIDIDRNGRFTLDEVRIVARAVEAVEREHPDLAGGMGIYTGGHLRNPYVHIDARGKRARWNGAG